MSYIIRIGSSSDTAGIDKAGNSLRKVGTDADAAKAKLGGLNGYLGKFHEQIGSIPGLGLVFGGIASGAALLGGAFRLASESIRAFAASEVEMAKLDAALANSGKLTDQYREKLSRLATARSQATAIDDEKYLGVFTTLTKFGADTSNIERYTNAVENLAGFLDGDMEQAAFLFGKAMQGSTEMLGRYGISVDKSKDSTEQLADIMRQLEARGGGQLEAQAATLQGSFSKVKNAWENLLESMGSAAEKSGLAQALSNWAEGVQIIADKLGGGTQSKTANREELIGATPELQAEADSIASQRRELQKLKALKMADSSDAFSRMDAMLPGNPRRKKFEDIISANDQVIAHINSGLDNLSSRQQSLGIKSGTPAEATAAREQQAEASAQAEKNAKDQEALRLKKEEADLNKNALFLQLKISEAVASGNEEEAKRLRWIAEYNKSRREGLAAGLGENDAISYATRSANAAVKEHAEKRDTLEIETQIAEARAGGNDAELKRLEWLKEYNRLIADGFREDQARRAANAMSAGAPQAQKSDITKPGELFSGTNHRRGATESDAFHESALNLAPGASLLDQYKATQSRPVGSINGASILPADPLSSLRPTSASSPGGESAKSGVADAGKEAGNAAKSAGAEAASAVRQLGATISAGFQGIKQQISAVESKVASLSSGT